MGTFTIRHTNEVPAGQKEGGNVVAYFCTPDFEVLHAVGGTLSPAEFLKQAEWAVGLAGRLERGDAQEREELAALAHAEGSPELFPPRTWNGG